MVQTKRSLGIAIAKVMKLAIPTKASCGALLDNQPENANSSVCGQAASYYKTGSKLQTDCCGKIYNTVNLATYLCKVATCKLVVRVHVATSNPQLLAQFYCMV